jgi:hypothetical protein
MPIQVLEPTGNPITVKISGLLKKEEFTRLQGLFLEAVKHQRKFSLLVMLEGFEGWDEKDDWNSVPFHLEYDQQVQKVAIVGDAKWEDLFAAFLGKGMRGMQIRHFLPAQLDAARTWLS